MPGLDFGFLEYWNTVAQHDSVFQNSPFIVTTPFSKCLEIQANLRAECSKKARIRA
jgi:hypothetical protein